MEKLFDWRKESRTLLLSINEHAKQIWQMDYMKLERLESFCGSGAYPYSWTVFEFYTEEAVELAVNMLRYEIWPLVEHVRICSKTTVRVYKRQHPDMYGISSMVWI